MQRLSPGRVRDHPVMDIIPNKALSLSLSLSLSLETAASLELRLSMRTRELADHGVHARLS